ncbi:MAG: type I-E CRISPR-associated endonuclease Cas1 [Microthrixaceae bacterium]|nr:type I-E CRISPR-associated endonuclease Cas1 [Microthrixaceae bacterium]
MPLREETIRLQNPAIAALPRLVEQLTFLHVSKARLIQDETGVVALMEENEQPLRVPLPTASVAAVLLGPGCSITTAAMSTIAKHGTALLWVGSDGSRTHCWTYSLTSSARWAEAQAALWADPIRRKEVAVAMYEKRFGGLPPGGTVTLRRLRGLEGQRMKRLYKALADKHRIKFRRDYDPNDFGSGDPINQALSAANAALYGIALAAITALGCHPGLGFVHSGSIAAFVHDIADLYKADTSIPAAFQASHSAEPALQARRLTRDAFLRAGILERAVRDIQDLLKAGLAHTAPAEGLLRDDHGYVPGGTNYASQAGDEAGTSSLQIAGDLAFDIERDDQPLEHPWRP